MDFFVNDTAPTEIYPLSLHDALPIFSRAGGFSVEELLRLRSQHGDRLVEHVGETVRPAADLFQVEADVLVPGARIGVIEDRKSTRLNSSHSQISDAGFCL